MAKSCRLCLYSDCCDGKSVCKHYCPVELDDNDIQEYVEERYNEFYEEWLEYIREDSSFTHRQAYKMIEG